MTGLAARITSALVRGFLAGLRGQQEASTSNAIDWKHLGDFAPNPLRDVSTGN